MEDKVFSNNENLIKKIVSDVKKDMSNEEVIKILLEREVLINADKDYTFGQKASDRVADFTGSWKFIGAFTLCVILWITLNGLRLTNEFDCFPYVLLNLVLSCIAAIQAPLIMMSQKRQEQKDRERGENDYRIDLKAGIIIADIHKKMEKIQKDQEKIKKYIESCSSKS